MFRVKATSCILLWLILFQSFSAVANSLDYHAIDSQHLSEVHEHQLGDNSINEMTQTNADNSLTTDSSHNPADCHHCGHCHGSHAQWVGHTAGIRINSNATNHAFHYLSRVIDAPIAQLLRPPKA
ncbi:MAG: hypothetical protein ACI8R9_001878 [Paraglaciecola sp.]|jgi:hypothetical protein